MSLPPSFKETLKLNLRKKQQEEKPKVEMVRDKNYPEHVGHGLKGELGRYWAGTENSFIENVDYFDAMFVSMKVRCGCGEILEITREMMDQV